MTHCFGVGAERRQLDDLAALVRLGAARHGAAGAEEELVLRAGGRRARRDQAVPRRAAGSVSAVGLLQRALSRVGARARTGQLASRGGRCGVISRRRDDNVRAAAAADVVVVWRLLDERLEETVRVRRLVRRASRHIRRCRRSTCS